MNLDPCLKNVGCIKEAKSTELHFTTKNKLKRATYYIISNHSLVAIFKTLGSALLTITKNNMLLIDFTYHSFSSFLGGYNFLHSQWTRLNLEYDQCIYILPVLWYVILYKRIYKIVITKINAYMKRLHLH